MGGQTLICLLPPAVGFQAHPRSSLNLWCSTLSAGLLQTAPMPFSRHSTTAAGSSRSSGATSTSPTPLPFPSLEAVCTGRTGGPTLWREPTSGRGRMWRSSRRPARSHLTCRSSTPAGSHEVKQLNWLLILGKMREHSRKQRDCINGVKRYDLKGFLNGDFTQSKGKKRWQSLITRVGVSVSNSLIKFTFSKIVSACWTEFEF